MFKLDPSPTFFATVPISVPGSAPSLPLRLDFRHMSSSALDKWLDDVAGRSNAEVVADMVASVDASAKAPDQSDAEFLAALCEAYPAAKRDIFNVFIRELTESRLKN
jgi:hypothetical protein